MTPAEYNRNLPAPGDYARSWRKLNEIVARDPDQIVRIPGAIVGMAGWGYQTERASVVLRSVERALDARINARAGYVPREPREDEMSAWRDSRRVRDILTRRLRVYQFETRQARARLGHLLADRND